MMALQVTRRALEEHDPRRTVGRTVVMVAR